jgi:bifunctional non-homologous end joining protein LigD
MPVTERKERLRALLSSAGSPLHFSDHQIGHGRPFYDHACTLKVEGIVSKRVDAPYAWRRSPKAGRWAFSACG